MQTQPYTFWFQRQMLLGQKINMVATLRFVKTYMLKNLS